MNDFTPGPWRVWQDWVVHGPDCGERICTVDGNNSDANARLLAAAPDLLEVLKELLENGACYHSAIEFDHGYDGERWEAKALTTIAKAEAA